MVPLQQFDLVPVLEGMGKPLTDIAAPADEDALVGFDQGLEFAHHRLDVVTGGNEEHLVPVFNHRVALGHDRPVFAEDGRHPGIDLGHVGAQVRQLMAHQRATLGGTDGHKAGQALGKLQYLEGAGVLDQPGDVFGHQVFGADQNINGKTPQAVEVLGLVALVEKFGFRQIGVGSYPAYGGRGLVQQFGHLAGDHICLVTVGDGNQHVGVFGPGLSQCRGIGRRALNGADVEPVLQFAQSGTIAVDNGDVVGFVG